MKCIKFESFNELAEKQGILSFTRGSDRVIRDKTYPTFFSDLHLISSTYDSLRCRGVKAYKTNKETNSPLHHLLVRLHISNILVNINMKNLLTILIQYL